MRTQAKILKPWYFRSVVDRSITRAFRQTKSYSAVDVFNAFFLLRDISYDASRCCLKHAQKENKLVFNQYLTFHFINI